MLQAPTFGHTPNCNHANHSAAKPAKAEASISTSPQAPHLHIVPAKPADAFEAKSTESKSTKSENQSAASAFSSVMNFYKQMTQVYMKTGKQITETLEHQSAKSIVDSLFTKIEAHAKKAGIAESEQTAFADLLKGKPEAVQAMVSKLTKQDIEKMAKSAAPFTLQIKTPEDITPIINDVKAYLDGSRKLPESAPVFLKDNKKAITAGLKDYAQLMRMQGAMLKSNAKTVDALAKHYDPLTKALAEKLEWKA